jgi:formate dehydrogenase (NADP+) alpha subunit
MKVSYLKGLIVMSERTQVETTCAYCGTGCGLIIDVEDDRIVRVRGNKAAPVNQGQTCIKGAFGYHYIHSEDRLRTPLIKKNGKFTEATWQEALNHISTKLTAIKQQFGGDAFSMFACARATNEVNYVTQKFTRAVMNTNNIDGCNRT